MTKDHMLGVHEFTDGTQIPSTHTPISLKFWDEIEGLSAFARMVYLIICRCAKNDGTSTPTIKAMAGHLGLSFKTVQRAVNELVEFDMIRIEKIGSFNQYRIVDEFQCALLQARSLDEDPSIEWNGTRTHQIEEDIHPVDRVGRRAVLLALVALSGGCNCHYCSCKLDPQWGDKHEEVYPLGNTGFEPATIDHVIPISNGGTNALSNLVLACSKCNSRKGTKSYAQFMDEIRK